MSDTTEPAAPAPVEITEAPTDSAQPSADAAAARPALTVEIPEPTKPDVVEAPTATASVTEAAAGSAANSSDVAAPTTPSAESNANANAAAASPAPTSPTSPSGSIRKRSRTKDDLLQLSPDLSVSGKRQRKVSTMFTGFAIDKKTSHVIGQEGTPIPTPSSPVVEGSAPATSVPAPATTSPATETQNHTSTAAPSAPAPAPAPATPGITATATAVASVSTSGSPPPAGVVRIKVRRGKDVVMSAQEAMERSKKLPKGYAFLPVAERREQPPAVVEGKRERKKPLYGDFVAPAKVDVKKPRRQKADGSPMSPDASPVPAAMPVTPSSPVYITPVASSPTTPSESPAAEGATAATPEGATAPIASPTTPLQADASKQRRPASGKKKGGRKPKSAYDNFESDEDELGLDDEEGVPAKKKKGKPKKNKVAAPALAAAPVSIAPSRAVTDPLMKLCEKATLKLMRHKFAWPFLQPVDPVALNLPDYFTLIRHPMDLGTVLKNIQVGYYKTLDEFVDHVRRIWSNCLAYNPPTDDISLMAKGLSEIFEKDLLNIRAAAAGLPAAAPLPASAGAPAAVHFPAPAPAVVPVASPVPAPVAAPAPVTPVTPPPPPKMDPERSQEFTRSKKEMETTISELRDSMRFVKEEIQKLRREKAVNTTTSAPAAPAHYSAAHQARFAAASKARSAKQAAREREREREAEEYREMTFEEKHALSVSINNLPPEHLSKVVQIIHQRNPHLAQQQTDEIEIDFDALDTPTLRALERYVRSCMAKRTGGGGGSGGGGKKKVAPKKHNVQGKLAQAELASAATSRSIQDVKKKLKELGAEPASKKRKKDEDEDVVIDSESSSSSDSSSSSSSSSSDSDSDSQKPAAKAAHTAAPKPAPANTAPALPVTPPIKGEESRDATLPAAEKEEDVDIEHVSPPRSPKRAETASSNNNNSNVPESPSPMILQATVQKEVELKNLDSWADLSSEEPAAAATTTANGGSEPAGARDETWTQFQSRDMQQKKREKERQEAEEKERRERAEREAERRRLHEQALSEQAAESERRKKAEEEASLAAQRDLAAKRAEAKAAREQQSSSKRINLMEQSLAMSSFEMTDSGQPSMVDVFKLKEGSPEGTAPPAPAAPAAAREEGEL